ncbi:DciA family protein [Thermodesulfovibrio sp. TK110]
MQRIGQVLPALFNNFGIEEAVTLKFLRKKWDNIFGSPVKEHTYPKELRNGVLYVTVNSHVWLAQLLLLKDEFLKKLNAYGIKDVELCFGRIYRKQKEKSNEKNIISLSLKQQEWIKDITKKIKDEEIRTTVENLLKNYLLFINQFKLG